MLGSIPGSIIILQNMANAHMEEALSSAELLSHQEKQQTNELYATKLITIVHFVARNNLSVKEMYPKMIWFLSDKTEETVLRQYLESSAKNATCESSDSCDSFLVSLNSYLKNTTCQCIVSADDILLFANEATSAARKEMMGVFIGYFDEVSKFFMLGFISLMSISCTESEILIEKIKEIIMNCGIDITNQDLYVLTDPSQWAVRKVVFRDAIKMMHISQYMLTVDAAGYYILNY